MKKRIVLLFVILISFILMNVGVIAAEDSQADKQKLITDMAGRELMVPTKINKIFAANNTGAVLGYCLVPDKLIGWNSKLNNNMKKYIKGKATSLPVMGTLYGNAKSKANLEEIALTAPDIILLMSPKITKKVINSADKITGKLGIPVIVIDGQFKNTGKTLEFLGGLLGEKERAEKLKDYFENVYQKVITIAVDIKQEQRVNVYYARGDKGLTTEIKGSPNTEILRLLRARNVVDLNISAENTSGLAGNYTVTMEQLLLWNPDLIIVGSGFYTASGLVDIIKEDKSWQSLKAVANRQLFFIPCAPFNWIDRPPSLNRIIGLVWAAENIYPDLYNFDLAEEIKKFYKLFYHYDLTETELNKLLDCRLK
ncbi:ABC transporter substrate-binding protein [Iocasia frigidifontis]|nr:ABC transporter substrate-binding protein [Iocasia fonsfrigidae]